MELKDKSLIESVLIFSENRRTVCVSSQVGCKAKCAFCASGKKGFYRNLTVAEIVEQALHISSFLEEDRVSHIVFMGMGEPLENIDNVLKAIFLLSKELGISQRRISLSTVGVVEGIERLIKEDVKINLILSLHAPNDEKRKKIIPYARKYSLEKILSVLDLYFQKSKRDLSFEYLLIENFNDQKEDAKALALLLKKRQASVNLIPYNPIEGLSFRRPSKETVSQFLSTLRSFGIIATQRYTKGKDIQAACGQLALQEAKSL